MDRLRKLPRAIGMLLVPTALALALDLVLRGSLLVERRAFGAYLGSLLLSAGLWGGPLWLASRLFLVPGGRARMAARAGLVALFGLFVLPFCTFAYGGQALYYRLSYSYIARDTVRFGLAVRSIVGEWLSLLGGGWTVFAIGGLGAVLALGFGALSRRAAPALVTAKPIVPAAAFAIATTCLWFDVVETRALQVATPDVCFAHGVVHAIREGLTGKGLTRYRISVRTPAPLPALAPSNHRPNVLLVITESVRADAICSDPPPTCRSRFLDDALPDRIGLGKLTTQSPGTISSCVLLWTGLAPNADFTTLHAAPTIWEIARAVGYRTAYVSAQNLKNEDFGLFVGNAGIDLQVSGTELGVIHNNLVGAPDERATARTLGFIRETPEGTPWFAVMHFSNTHTPYRVDHDLEPNQPHTSLPIGGYAALHNHYRNSVLLQERTFSSFMRELRALPSFEDTAVLFVSDHGEQFGEHGSLYHSHTLFEEEVRIPGFIVAGSRAVSDEQRTALRSFIGQRTYTQDVSATLLDLVGVHDARSSLPFAGRTTGRSLLRGRGPDEPKAVLSTSSAVWEPDAVCRGVMQGDRLLVETTGGHRACYDLALDPREKSPLPAASCGSLQDDATAAFR